MTGCLVSSGLMLAFSDVTWLRTLLFCVLTAATVCGTAGFLLLPKIDYAAGQDAHAQDESASVGAALRALADIKFTFMLPWIISNGMTFAFVNGDFTADVVTPLLSPNYIGIMMTGFYGTDAVCSIVWGRLIANRCFTRRTIFIITTLLWATFIIIKLVWKRDPNFEKVGDKWNPIDGTQIEPLDVVQPLVLAVIAGFADGFWTPGPPAVLQSFFADTGLLASMAAYKSLQSLGFAIQFILGATVKDATSRDSIILGCCAIAFVSTLVLDCRVQPLDPRSSTELGDALNSEQSLPPQNSSAVTKDQVVPSLPTPPR